MLFLKRLSDETDGKREQRLAQPRATDHFDRHGVIRGIQRGTAARNASYSLPNVCSSVGSSYATTKTWKKSQPRPCSAKRANASASPGTPARIIIAPMPRVSCEAVSDYERILCLEFSSTTASKFGSEMAGTRSNSKGRPGPGRRRGGLGVNYRIRLLAGEAELSFMMDHAEQANERIRRYGGRNVGYALAGSAPPDAAPR